jgi:2,3-bisphosphoglycerate-dependent phosphoglycerate mutase
LSNIFLIRHGESQSNAGMATLNPASVELTHLGMGQAECIADYLEVHVCPERIVTSCYLRARQTAAPTKSCFATVPVEEWPVHEFTYLSNDDFPTPSTVEDRKPLVDAYWELCNPRSVDGPGSESFEQFIARARDVMQRFAEVRIGQTVVIFSHEQFICAVYWLLKCKPERISSQAMRDFRAFLLENSIPNAGLLRLQRRDEAGDWEPDLVWPLLTYV